MKHLSCTSPNLYPIILQRIIDEQSLESFTSTPKKTSRTESSGKCSDDSLHSSFLPDIMDSSPVVINDDRYKKSNGTVLENRSLEGARTRTRTKRNSGADPLRLPDIMGSSPMSKNYDRYKKSNKTVSKNRSLEGARTRTRTKRKSRADPLTFKGFDSNGKPLYFSSEEIENLNKYNTYILNEPQSIDSSEGPKSSEDNQSLGNDVVSFKKILENVRKTCRKSTRGKFRPSSSKKEESFREDNAAANIPRDDFAGNHVRETASTKTKKCSYTKVCKKYATRAEFKKSQSEVVNLLAPVDNYQASNDDDAIGLDSSADDITTPSQYNLSHCDSVPVGYYYYYYVVCANFGMHKLFEMLYARVYVMSSDVINCMFYLAGSSWRLDCAFKISK